MLAYRAIALLLLSTSTSAALAADELKFGAPPPWIVPSPIPETSEAPADAPVAVMLADQQIALEPGKVSVYSETAIKIQNGQGLAIGNVSLPWDPATSTITVHKLEIHRGKEIIDVLATGQKFQTMRREGNLELAVLDGRLTANIQPEGLQVGDILDLAMTVEVADPVLKGHVETVFANWNGMPFRSARALLLWPKSIDLKFRRSDSLPALRMSTRGRMSTAEIRLENAQPLLAPKGAPLRYALGRTGEASDYKSWSQVADLLISSYQAAAVIPRSGPLRDEAERIRNATGDPIKRAELALALVQDRIRYVGLLMGAGGYVPAPAETTWSRRFGDCKAKTALLLALLHEFGIEAVPAAVNSEAGEALAGRLPMLSLFDHVLVRAKINGRTYWLDGTRTGDASLEMIATPNFGWVLPLVSGADLIPLSPAPLTSPSMDTTVRIGASSGIFASSPFKVERVLRGDIAKSLQLTLAKLTSAQLDQSMREYWRDIYDYVTISSASFSYDKEKAELKLSMIGDAKLDWKDGWFYVPHSGLAYEPDLERAPGPGHDAPWTVAFPSYEKARVTIQLPAGFSSDRSKSLSPVKETLAGVEYVRTAEYKNNVFLMERSERSVRPEVSNADATAAQARMKALANEDVYLRLPDDYRATDKDIQSRMADKPASANGLLERGLLLMSNGKWDEAIADFDEAHKLEPGSVWPLANRGLTYAWKRDFAAAERDLTAAEKIDPGNLVALRGRGLVAEMKGDFETALGAFTKSLARDPDDGFSLSHRAVALEMLGRSEEAIKAFDEAIAAQPNSDEALAQRALTYFRAKNYDRAEKDLAAVLALKPQSVPAWLLLGEIAKQRGNSRKAIEAYSKIIEIEPDNPFAVVSRAEAYRDIGDDAKALADSERALSKKPDTPDLRLLRANIYLSKGDTAAVAREAELMARDNPKSDYAQVAAGKVFAKLGMRQAAMGAFDRALSISPDAYIYINRAQARSLSDIEGRLADLEQAIRLDPVSAEALDLKAWELQRQGKYDEALRINEQAIKSGVGSGFFVSGRSDAPLKLARAAILYKAGRTSEAEQIFREQRATAITYSDFNSLCWRKGTVGAMLETALDDCRQSLKLKPEDGGTLDSLGLVLFKLGRLDEALSAYDHAIAKRSSASSLLGRALVYKAKGNGELTEADRKAALKLDPEIEESFAEYGLKLDTK